MPGMRETMGEFKRGTLHSGSKTGPLVRSRKQAIAIGLSQQADAVEGATKKNRKAWKARKRAR